MAESVGTRQGSALRSDRSRGARGGTDIRSHDPNPFYVSVGDENLGVS